MTKHWGKSVFIVLLAVIAATGAPAAGQDAGSPAEEDSTATKRGKPFSGYPYAYYTPETELAFGVGGIFLFYTSSDPDTKPSKTVISGWYSTNKQYKISLDPDMYFLDNNLVFRLPMSFGYFVDKFWGVGNNTVETGTETYTRNVFSITLNLQSPPIFFSADRSGLIIDYDNTKIDDKEKKRIFDRRPGGRRQWWICDWIWVRLNLGLAGPPVFPQQGRLSVCQDSVLS
jgi:hypothetical protein